MARTTIRTEDITDGSVVNDDVNASAAITTSKITGLATSATTDTTDASNISSGTLGTARMGSGSASATTVLYGDGSWKAEPTTDTSGLEDDIALIGFKVAANGSLAKYDLVDQTVDDFQDASGVDASASTNEVRNSTGKYYSGAVSGNYFGDSSDGSVTTSGDVTHTVQNKSGSYDGDMVIKQYSALTVSSGDTMTVDQSCRGMFIYVAGDLTVNGTISMTGRGGHADPTASGGSDSNTVPVNGLQIGLKTSGGSSSFTNDGTGFNGAGTGVRTAVAASDDISGDGTIYTISRIGGAQGVSGATGAATIGTGGGANGGGFGPSGTGGSGGTGGAFSGGAGGGGAHGGPGSPASGGAGNNYGGAGGAAGPGGNIGGGAGNPAGGGGGGGPAGDEGVGGIIWLVVKGDVTIGASGSIVAHGKDAGKGGHGGGPSGGGAIHILYGGTYSNSGAVTATKGQHTGGGMAGGSAGDGGVNTAQVLADQFNNMTLISNATTAEAVPTKGDIVVTYTNGVGTNTINTDIKGYVSRDNGTTYTQGTLASQGTTGGHTILSFHDLDISGQPSGSSVRYKIETLNQSVSKEARIQAISLGWS